MILLLVLPRRPLLLAPIANAADAPDEALRKAAANLPGLGPPDVLYPRVFKGKWELQREAVSTQGDAAAFILDRARVNATHAVRFIEYGDDIHVVADRGYEAERRAAATNDTFRDATWDPSNPNVLTLEGGGGLLEIKVTKRSFEAPSDTTFGSSEYARIALAPPGGVLGGVPQIFAQRTQTRWKWDESGTIQGLELVSTYDPRLSGFGDLNKAEPVLVVKSRLRLERPLPR